MFDVFTEGERETPRWYYEPQIRWKAGYNQHQELWFYGSEHGIPRFFESGETVWLNQESILIIDLETSAGYALVLYKNKEIEIPHNELLKTYRFKSGSNRSTDLIEKPIKTLKVSIGDLVKIPENPDYWLVEKMSEKEVFLYNGIEERKVKRETEFSHVCTHGEKVRSSGKMLPFTGTVIERRNVYVTMTDPNTKTSLRDLNLTQREEIFKEPYLRSSFWDGRK